MNPSRALQLAEFRDHEGYANQRSRGVSLRHFRAVAARCRNVEGARVDGLGSWFYVAAR